MTTVAEYNALNNTVLTRQEVSEMIARANREGQTHIAKKLQQILDNNDDSRFNITVENKVKAMSKGLKGSKDNELDPAWFPKYKQFKGKPKQAIQHLLKEKKGDALKALYRKGIGYIDIVWGENDPKTNKGFGLKHIIEKHGDEIKQLGFKVEDFIPIVVQFGNLCKSENKSKVELKGDMFKVIISKQAYDKKTSKKRKKTFVLSAFDLRPLTQKEKSRGLNGTYDGISFTEKPLLSPTKTSKSKLSSYTQATIAIGENNSQSKSTHKKHKDSKNAQENGLNAEMLYGLSYASPEEFGEPGLGKPVSPDDIYDMITKKMVEHINEATGKGYVKKWKANAYGNGFLTPINFASKKPYRGINTLLLKDFDPLKVLENPYFLTFKQIDKLGGKLKKGSHGHQVVYFTILYTIGYKDKSGIEKEYGTYSLKKFIDFINKNRAKLITEAPKSWTAKQIAQHHTVPILKYYNVFALQDTTGIDFDLTDKTIPGKLLGGKIPPKQEIEAAELIINHYPTPTPKIAHGGDKAFYSYPANKVQVPKNIDFDTAQDYYRTLFHELTHCSGDPKHLNRDMSGRFGTKKYAKEELIAEWGATYLSAEAGIMWVTNKNHAEYMKGWNNVITHIKEDNRFVMRAASAAQKAADYILNRDNDGVPAYRKDLDKKVKPKEKETKAKKTDISALKSKKKNRKTLLKNYDVGKKKDLSSKGSDRLPSNGEDKSSKRKDTKTKPKTTKKPKNQGLKSPTTDIIKQKALETVVEVAKDNLESSKKSKKVRNIAAAGQAVSEYYNVPGAVGEFLQAVERKPHHSVVITLDGQQGAGKTTFLYKVMNAFAAGHNRGVFFSLEEHPDSALAREKAAKYINAENQQYIDVVGDLDDKAEFFNIVDQYDVIYLDSWQKLLRSIGNIKLDEDLRKKFDGKVFVIIFQQTTTGRTKGGSEVVFDGDIITKLVKEDKFADNYAYFDKNRYTRVPLETLRFNVAGGYVYNPNAPKDENTAATVMPQKTVSVMAVPID